MEIFRRSQQAEGLTREELSAAVEASLQGRDLHKVLILPPDFTRYHSNAGLLTNLYYHFLTDAGVQVDILPALGTHVPVTEEEMDLDYLPGDGVHADVTYALSNSLGFGGHNSSILLKKYDAKQEGGM